MNEMIKVGDIVTIRRDLCERYDHPGSPGYVPYLEQYRGRIVTVAHVTTRLSFNSYVLRFKEIPYNWSSAWIEPIERLDIKQITSDEIEKLIKGD